MKKICKVTVNDEPFLANCGDLLLDWALMNGVDLPHDCRAGICGACKVRLVDGKVFGGQTRGDDMIHACQARIVSDLEIAIEAAPEPTTLPARVAQTVQLAPDVVGVDVELPKSLEILPGQYCKLQFQGFPARPYSPTYPLEGRPHDRVLHFHVRKVSDGLVSSALGRDIRAGHRVKLTGPFGRAFFRAGHTGRVVLVASGTGFAPMWSVAVAAIMEQPERELVFVVAGAEHPFALHARRAVPAGAVSQRDADSDGIGAAKDLACRSQRKADRSSAEADAGRRGLYRGCAGHDRRRGADCKGRGRPLLHRSLRAGAQGLRTGRLDVAAHRLAQRAKGQAHCDAAGATGKCRAPFGRDG